MSLSNSIESKHNTLPLLCGQNREYCESYLTCLIYPHLALGVGSLGPAAVGHQAVSQCHYLLCEDKACLNPLKPGLNQLSPLNWVFAQP